jgi:asparagine synthase (glutamine-hydrolysing)
VCGIAGIFRSNGEAASRETLDFMNRVQAHRGPDGSDIFLDGPVGLAHVRLAILDLTEAGHQPLTLEGYTLTYNGEVYNYRELRVELEQLGHRFRSDCDTEVVLRSFLEWGSACVRRFNGMFAFAIWDSKEKVLFCARDRLGIKPFLYVHDEAGFEFASDVRALLHQPERRKPRLRTLVRFFGEGLTDDEWDTFFENIRILPPAHTMTVSPRGLKLERYWRLNSNTDWQQFQVASPSEVAFDESRLAADSYFPNSENLHQAADAFRELFTDSVKLRLRSDVPVGTCLSGGLDSSSVVACASSLIDRPVETFSSIYPDRGYDERRFIDDVVTTFGTNPHPIEPDGRDLPDIFDKIVWAQGEPTAGPGLYSQWKVMETAQKNVTVLLDGQGGDELLGGYHYYFSEYLAELAKDLLKQNEDLNQVLEVSKVIDRVTGRDHTSLAHRAIRRAKRPKILNLFQRDRPGRVKTPDILSKNLTWHRSRKDATRMNVDRIFSNTLSQRLYDDLVRFSIPSLLRYEDRNSMAFSLEARVPFLDHRLVEFCFALPYEFKIDPPHTKLVLRVAMNGRLPKSVTQREDKLGYPTPVASWFRKELRSWITDLFYSQGFRDCDLFDAAACQSILETHQQGDDRSWELWRILHGYRWSELFLCGKGFTAQIGM